MLSQGYNFLAFVDAFWCFVVLVFCGVVFRGFAVLFVVVLFDVFVMFVVSVVYAVVASGVECVGGAVDVYGAGVDFPVDFTAGMSRCGD